MMPAGSHTNVDCSEERAGGALASRAVLATSDYRMLATGAAV